MGRSTNQERQITIIVLWIAATRGGKTVKDHIVLTSMRNFHLVNSFLCLEAIYDKKKSLFDWKQALNITLGLKTQRKRVLSIRAYAGYF